MDPSLRYDLIRLLHVGADIVFVAGLIAGSLALAALSMQTATELARERRLVAGLRRFHRVVTGPALLVVWACGLWLAWQAGWFASGWLHTKLVLVLGLSALHGALSAALRRAGADAPAVPGRAWRVLSPLAIAATLAIVWLAWAKPF
jgi:putative membrane protein